MPEMNGVPYMVASSVKHPKPPKAKWYGNMRIQDVLTGPFFGLKMSDAARAIELDHSLRRWGQFTSRYFSIYVVCSGPQLGEALNASMTPEEAQEVVIYEGATYAECITAIFEGEQLALTPGYDEKNKPPAPHKGPGF